MKIGHFPGWPEKNSYHHPAGPDPGRVSPKTDESRPVDNLTDSVWTIIGVMPDGGKITIEIDNVSLTEKECQSCGCPIIGEFVMLAVSDDGPGIDKAFMKNIFEPFFTTKRQGLGTGLGLSTVLGIVHQNKVILMSIQNRDLVQHLKYIFRSSMRKQNHWKPRM